MRLSLVSQVSKNGGCCKLSGYHKARCTFDGAENQKPDGRDSCHAKNLAWQLIGVDL